LKQDRDKNKNKLLTKTNLRDFFAKFYNFAIKFFSNFKLLTKLLNKNIISFYFNFVCTLFAYIFLKK